MTSLDHFRYFRLWLLASMIGLLVVAVTNLLVDPIDAFPRVHSRMLEPYRPQLDSRPSKAELAHQSGWEIVLLGSSRVLGGFPADYPLFRSNRTVNLAMKAPMINELATALQTVRANNGQAPRLVILGLDFYTFANGPDHVQDFMESRFNPDLDLFDYYAKRLIGYKDTGDSFITLNNLFRAKALTRQERDGFIEHRVRAGFTHRSAFDQTMRSLVRVYYAMHYVTANRFEVLRKIIHECRDEGIDLRLVLMPVHALEIELLHACGKGESFEDFKRSLVRFLADDGSEGKVPFLDATGYAGPVVEDVPPAEVRGLTMKYFLENSHARPALGELVLNRLFGTGGTNQFGVFLTSANVDEHLAQVRKDREEYLHTHPADGRWPHRIMDALGVGKPLGSSHAPAEKLGN